MGKDYDRYVTPQNTPRFSERKILFLMAMGGPGAECAPDRPYLPGILERCGDLRRLGLRLCGNTVYG